MKEELKNKFNILGGGFSGLSLAWYLQKKGCEVSVYEEANRLGGLLGTATNANGIAERAANGIMNSDLLMELVSDLGLTPLFSNEAAKKRYIERDGPRRFPLTVLEAFDLAFKASPLLWQGKERLRPHHQETLKEWGYRNLGPGATNFLIKPAMNGIYAGDVARMSAKLITSSLIFTKPEAKVKGLMSFKGGMQELIDALEKHLRENGVRFYLGQAPEVKANENWIVSTSAWAAAKVLKQIDPEISQALEKIECLPLMTVTAYFENKLNDLQGFGCLFSDNKKTRALGVLMNSNIYDHRGPKYSEAWIFGGALDLNALQMSDEDVKKEILRTRKEIFGSDEKLLDLVITRWPQALPHYTVALESVIEKLNTSNIQLHGNYLSGIGLSHILSRSHKLANQLAGA
jgi:oxygen-dependent protoporphyrinogen oxidase